MRSTRLNDAPRVWVKVFQALLLTIQTCLLILIHRYRKGPSITGMDHYLHLWARKMVQSIGLRLRVHNPNQFKFEAGKRYILMCNHTSMYDIPVSLHALQGQSIRMLTKKELFRVPLLGQTLKASDFISIDRKNSAQAIKDLERAKIQMEQGIIIWIAPEGTRSRDGKLLPFKKGGFHLAIKTQAIIVPLAIQGMDKVMPAGTLSLQYGQQVNVHIGQPVDASTLNKQDIPKLMKAVQQQISQLIGQELD